jgi:hypothetical protein
MEGFYRDENGFVGDREPPRDKRAEADEARRVALDVADEVSAELDRHDSDAGDNPDALHDIAARLAAIRDELRAIMGPMRRMAYDRYGRPLGLVSEPRQ